MIDFLTIDTGDFLLMEQEDFPKFKLSFLPCENKAFKISFLANTGANIINKDKYSFKLSFISGLEDKKYRALFVEDEHLVLRQQIAIFLRTEKGALKDFLNYGSTIAQFKHEDMTNLSIMARLEDRLNEEIKAFDNELEVKVNHEIGTGAFYCQNLNIVVTKNNSLIYETNWEV